ncbi:amidohydrolase [Pedobacter changchengzhani]|uniref:Amidohydrolase n=1 Tax=Pedobacter changchengzhani TaxID=2529274 RepID=A0A4R5MPU8_9SPHI|nr:amidohydrolase family protein [Pedobacter changchengzhani]TDG37738.1 amidohydrolase [Pedobacter changchengzhani]
MITYFSADWIFPVSSPPIKNGAVAINSNGEIIEVCTEIEFKKLNIIIDKYKGAIVPGFINTHCHLELSHLHGKIEEHTGLPLFIKSVLAHRQQTETEVTSAMQNADEEMYTNGIVAVGDISNVAISKSIKLKSKLYYHTFVEVLGFNRLSAPIIEAAIQVKKDFAPLKASIVPHAPYSVSADLFNEINQVIDDDDISSIHNQETKGENDLFENGKGTFADFFAEIDIAQSDAHNKGRNSLHYHLPLLNKNINTLLVHNTFSGKADVDFANGVHEKLFWCLCPNANLYIENNLPDVNLLATENLKITLGTDSLASNHQLNILAEMQVLQIQKNIDFEELLKWATLNGAEFLKIEKLYGSIEKGKRPGLNLIQLSNDFKIKDIKVQKLC